MKALDFTGACISRGDFVAFVHPEDGLLHRGVVADTNEEWVELLTSNGNDQVIVSADNIIVLDD